MLKTDYKDAMYDGARKYRIKANTDGTSVIADETVYTQEGDAFGAKDINATNMAVNQLNHTTPVTLAAATGSVTAVKMTGMSDFIATLYSACAIGVAIPHIKSTFFPANVLAICAEVPPSACAF